MALRKRSKKIDYDENTHDRESSLALHMSGIKSTSNWDDTVTSSLKIKVSDAPYENMFECDSSLFEEAEMLLIPDWHDDKWLEHIDISLLKFDNKIKTVIGKIKSISIAKNSITEMVVDGFMDSLLHILRFDDYPCYMFPQYEYSATVGYNHTIRAKSDFGIVSQQSKVVLVVEDKTMNNASYTNNWRESHILGELFVAVHNVTSKMVNKVYPVNIYAIRVVGTLFTFYRTVATLEYVKETAKNFPTNTTMIVQRYPLVDDEPSGLVKYNICNIQDRAMILKCMCSIQRFMSV